VSGNIGGRSVVVLIEERGLVVISLLFVELINEIVPPEIVL
jgi:hypothetical protein